jgi:hypothetical protein
MREFKDSITGDSTPDLDLAKLEVPREKHEAA